MQDIAERMIDKMSNCSRLVEKLRLKNMLERKACPNDRRQVEIIITEKGMEVLKVLDEKLPLFHEELHHLTKAEASTLNALLDKLRG
jgi:DNA-binding MarR family transcriptional regulator